MSFAMNDCFLSTLRRHVPLIERSAKAIMSAAQHDIAALSDDDQQSAIAAIEGAAISLRSLALTLNARKPQMQSQNRTKRHAPIPQAEAPISRLAL
jgi:predicted RNA-binding protein with PIN domain